MNLLRKTIERFKADQNNLELWEALRLNKTVADDREAYSILVETCIVKMQEEWETWTDKEKVSPMVSKIGSAQGKLRVFMECLARTYRYLPLRYAERIYIYIYIESITHCGKNNLLCLLSLYYTVYCASISGNRCSVLLLWSLWLNDYTAASLIILCLLPAGLQK